MTGLTAILADASLPEVPGLNPGPSSHLTGSHIPPAFVGLAAFALLLVGYLVWDFCRQKRAERQQRQRLESFRAKKFKESSTAPILKDRQDNAHG